MVLCDYMKSAGGHSDPLSRAKCYACCLRAFAPAAPRHSQFCRLPLTAPVKGPPPLTILSWAKFLHSSSLICNQLVYLFTSLQSVSTCVSGAQFTGKEIPDKVSE